MNGQLLVLMNSTGRYVLSNGSFAIKFKHPLLGDINFVTYAKYSQLTVLGYNKNAELFFNRLCLDCSQIAARLYYLRLAAGCQN
jgi:hypothetical protein